MKKPLLAACLVSLGAVWLGRPSTALASPDYPSIVAEHLGMECTPQCTLCHASNPGNGGNAVQPFITRNGKRSEGDKPANERELITFLDDVAALGDSPDADVDRDGIPDLQELTAVPPTDPNDRSNETDICQLDVRYGCGAASVAPPRGPLGWVGYVVLGLFGVAFALRRLVAPRARP